MFKKQTDTGAKAYQRKDGEWRIKPYSDWHRTLPKNLLALDVDFIEWRYRNNEPVAVGVMEVTRVDNNITVTPNYLAAIIRRFETRDFQARAARRVAEALGTKAYIVLFRENCTEFWTYNLTDSGEWSHFNEAQMQDFLKRLG